MESNKKHELLSPIASMDAQLQLLKRSKEYENFTPRTKDTLSRLEEKLKTLHIRIKSLLEESS